MNRFKLFRRFQIEHSVITFLWDNRLLVFSPKCQKWGLLRKYSSRITHMNAAEKFKEKIWDKNCNNCVNILF